MRRSDEYRALVADAAVLAGAAPETEQTGRQHGVAGRGPTKLDDDWSPQQIAQWPRREHPGDVARRVSHESIYRDVSMPSRNVFYASMFHRLRSDRPIRRPRGKRCWHGRGRIRNMVCIHERPTQAGHPGGGRPLGG